MIKIRRQKPKGRERVQRKNARKAVRAALLKPVKERITELDREFGRARGIKQKARIAREIAKLIFLSKAPISNKRLVVHSLKAKDLPTYLHSERVETVSNALARRFGWRVRFSKRMHDLGKLFVPKEILSGSHKLSEQERRIIENHPHLGSVIAKAVTGQHYAEIRGHHERIDGSGYPDRLKGNAIPTEAKITAVVDVFDAMADPMRKYKKPMSVEEVLFFLEGQKGLDQNVVSCLQLVVAEEIARRRIEGQAYKGFLSLYSV